MQTLKDLLPASTLVIAVVGVIFFFGSLSQRVTASENTISEIKQQLYRIEDKLDRVLIGLGFED